VSEPIRRHLILTLLLGIPLLAVCDPRIGGGISGRNANHASLNHGRLLVPDVTRPRPGRDQHPQQPTVDARPESDLTRRKWFRAAREDLRELGAVYMRLERWHGDRTVYQFRCDLKLDPEDPVGQTFCALSESAKSATEHVQREARRWYRASSRSPQWR
jgi:hypothetical protein